MWINHDERSSFDSKKRIAQYFITGSKARLPLFGKFKQEYGRTFFQVARGRASCLAQEIPELWFREIKLNGSYFGGVRKDKKGVEPMEKSPVVGLLKRNGQIDAFPSPNA